VVSKNMTPARWAQITDLFGHALDLPPQQRAAYLEGLKADDPQSAHEVGALIDAHERQDDFLPDLPAAPPTTDLSGRTLGPYRLTQLLGSGGMGTVYRAERSDGVFSKQVAVKLLSPAFVQARDRFHRERDLLARLEHPNIARLIDGGTTPEGWPYLVMEYVEGTAIDRYCVDRGLSRDDRLSLLLQVCAGIAHAHQRLVMHCDIKPENILVTADGTAKLLDFGIAKLIGGSGKTTVWRPGTPAFASPEQLQGNTATTTSDVYSIGVLAYVVLTGHWPYPRRPRGLADAVQSVLSDDPVAASRLLDVSPLRARRLRDLDNVLIKAVAKDPNRRYASVEQLADDLEAYRRGFPVRARADSIAYRLAKFVGRHRMGSAAAALSVVAIVAAFAVSWREARIAQRRYEDLRQFAHSVVVDVNDSLAGVPGTTASRKMLVETALRYLDHLGNEGRPDPSLREGLASAYIQVGKVQGGAFLPNLGDTAGAIRSFQRAIASIGPSPAGPSLERLRMEAHLNIAQLAAAPMDGAPDFDRAIAAGEAYLVSDASDVAAVRLVAQAYHGKATIAHLTDNVPDHERFAIRAVELRERVMTLAPDSWQDEIARAREYAQHALALAQNGDPAAALAQLQRAQHLLETTNTRVPSNQLIVRGLAELHSRATSVLVSLGRIPEAIAEGSRAIQLLTPLVESDPLNAQYKADLATAWLRQGDAHRAAGRLDIALALSRQALAIRRVQSASNSSMFGPWGLATNLNVVGELLMAVSPRNWAEARTLFSDARDLAEKTLAIAPSFNEFRKELAISYEGLADAAAAQQGTNAADVRLLLERSATTWREVAAHSVGDHRERDRRERVEKRLASLLH
jgi:non-specific serine/threonine protein kinase/serine/threonine-protein kinase